MSTNDYFVSVFVNLANTMPTLPNIGFTQPSLAIQFNTAKFTVNI